MSNTEKVIRVWDEVLREFCGCYPDAEGNRPCDNGTLCDKCMTESISKIYKERLAR